ncbi:MAG: hypothetical protein CMQ45_06935 [Gammaproteobacteria bacterium]|nr:hypothetical protein [Gammaproteobacteria bacterium]
MKKSPPPMKILAFNDAEDSENRIHSDEVARRYGFSSALVSGVNLFGYLTQPLIRQYGEQFLQQGMLDVAFLKPAYQNDLLTIRCESRRQEHSSRSNVTCAYNEEGTLLAKLESWLPHELPAIKALADSQPGKDVSVRPEISTQAITLGLPSPILHWRPKVEDNKAYVSTQRDGSTIYEGDNGFVHPYFLLEMCNTALKNMYLMPAWVHTASKLALRGAVRVGRDYRIKAIPTKKWVRKGHEFILLYLVFHSDDAVVLEVEHTAIYKLAG